MAKKDRYNYSSPAAAGLGLAVTGAVSMIPAATTMAGPLGTIATGLFGGVDLTDEERNIKKKFDEAINKTWDQIYDDYKLTDVCFSKLKQEVTGVNTSTDEFVENSQRKKLEESYALVIETILKKYNGGLERKSNRTWDDEYIKNASKDIASRLISTLQNVFSEDDLLKILKAIADRSKDIRGDIAVGRAADRLEHEQLMQMLAEISELIKGCPSPTTTNFKRYYESVKKRFTRNKKKEYAELVGNYSDKEAYIDAYITVEDKRVCVLSFLKKWFREDDYGTLLIHGEPGHGKTLLCNKAVFEYCNGDFLTDKATNVLTVSLNTGDNPRIIDNGMVVLENALTWRENKKSFTFEDCSGALLFMDGFDEFIDEAKKADIKNIVSFMKLIDKIADQYDIHIVVLSRTIAVESYLEELSAGNCYKLLPITSKQQDDWLDRHSEYDDYKGTFYELRNNGGMRELFEIPFLFRLIVHSRFSEVSTNVVELYGKLFKHLMSKRDVYGTYLETVIVGLENLAYEIYCDDTDTALISEKERDKHWIIVFYLKLLKKRRVGFYHRSFYQFFLARYIYNDLLNVNDVETFIGSFAERELDDTTCKYLSLMNNEKNIDTLYSNLNLVIDTLIKTEGYLSFEPHCPEGNAEKKKLNRTINIYRNTLHICNALNYVIQVPFRCGMDIFLRLYPSNKITIKSELNNRADLVEANLERAYLNKANLSWANISKANLTEANISGSNLIGAILTEADLRSANLSYANLANCNLDKAIMKGCNLTQVNLSGAHLKETSLVRSILRGANLREADFTGSDLSEADLRNADLSYADLSRANLSRADLSGANLSRAYLNGANLKGANLKNTLLKGVYLSRAILEEPNIHESSLNYEEWKRQLMNLEKGE